MNRRSLDLFAGHGGLSIGLRMPGLTSHGLNDAESAFDDQFVTSSGIAWRTAPILFGPEFHRFNEWQADRYIAVRNRRCVNSGANVDDLHFVQDLSLIVADIGPSILYAGTAENCPEPRRFGRETLNPDQLEHQLSSDISCDQRTVAALNRNLRGRNDAAEVARRNDAARSELDWGKMKKRHDRQSAGCMQVCREGTPA